MLSQRFQRWPNINQASESGWGSFLLWERLLDHTGSSYPLTQSIYLAICCLEVPAIESRTKPRTPFEAPHAGSDWKPTPPPPFPPPWPGGRVGGDVNTNSYTGGMATIYILLNSAKICVWHLVNVQYILWNWQMGVISIIITFTLLPANL